MIVEDVELRFVERTKEEEIGRQMTMPGGEVFITTKAHTVRILQMRKLVRRPIPGPFIVVGEGYGPEEWTDWQDVPLVKE
jgi:hypothetical protein